MQSYISRQFPHGKNLSGSLAGLVKVQVNITVKFPIHTVRESELDVTISAQE
mgnify:FL=1|jgi:hypothetical protein